MVLRIRPILTAGRGGLTELARPVVVRGAWCSALAWGGGRAGRLRAGWASPVRTPCLHYSKHPIRSQRGGNNGQTPGEIGFPAPLFLVQVLVRLLLAPECPARANAELADNFRAFFRRQKTAARWWTPGANSGRAEASPAKTQRDTLVCSLLFRNAVIYTPVPRTGGDHEANGGPVPGDAGVGVQHG